MKSTIRSSDSLILLINTSPEERGVDSAPCNFVNISSSNPNVSLFNSWISYLLIAFYGNPGDNSELRLSSFFTILK